MAMVGKPTIFVSYSHKDQEWLDYLKSHFSPALRAGSLDVWDDTRLRGGDDWQAEIEKAMRTCKVCILLVSRHSLTSDYIDRVEMKTILERVAKEGVRIYPVFVSPVHVPNEHWLRKYNWRPRDGRSLKQFDDDSGNRDATMVSIVDELVAVLNEKPPARAAARSTPSPVINSRVDLERWLADMPRDFGRIIAVRAAIRVAPLLCGLKVQPGFKGEGPSNLLLPLLRGMSTPWAAARYPAYRADIRPAAVAAAFAAAAADNGFAAAFASFADAAAIPAGTYASDVDARAVDDTVVAVAATAAASSARTDVAANALAARAAAWEAVTIDATALVSSADVSALAAAQLWPNGVPAIITRSHAGLSNQLLSRKDEGWWHWLAWLNDRFENDPERRAADEEKEFARLTLPEDLWEEGTRSISGVKAVNAEIARRLAEIDERRAVQARAIPAEPDEAEGTAFTFSGEDGLTLSRPTEGPAIDEADVTASLHKQLYDLLPRLREATHKVSNRHPDLARVVALYADTIAVPTSALHVAQIWGTGAQLSGLADAFASQNSERTLSDPLEPAHLGLLTAAARLHGAFILGFPLGRKLTENADRFRLAAETLAAIGRPMAEILEGLGEQDGWVETEARRFMAAMGGAYHATGWRLAASAHSAYVAVRNALVVITRHLMKANSALATVVGGLGLARVDPGLEMTQLAITFIGEHAKTIMEFASPFPELRAWFAWVIDHLDAQAERK